MDELTNLKEETLGVLKRNNKTLEDIIFITKVKRLHII